MTNTKSQLLTRWNHRVTVSQSWFCLDRFTPVVWSTGQAYCKVWKVTEPELKNRFLGLSAFYWGCHHRSQIRKIHIGVARFNRLRLFTWALIGADCRHSPMHGTKKRQIKKRESSNTNFSNFLSPLNRSVIRSERAHGSLCRIRFQRLYGYTRLGTVFLVLEPKYRLQVAMALPRLIHKRSFDWHLRFYRDKSSALFKSPGL
jgi:hypothetical protein